MNLLPHSEFFFSLFCLTNSPIVANFRIGCPTSSGRGSHRITPITCHQVNTTPTICPKAIQDTITQACHRILCSRRNACVLIEPNGSCKKNLNPWILLLLTCV